MSEKQEGSQRSWSEWRERGGGRSIVSPEGSFKSLLLPLFPLSSLIWARLSSHGLRPQPPNPTLNAHWSSTLKSE